MSNQENKLMTCPYDEAHKVKASRLQLHIAKCKLNHLGAEKEACPFNAQHRFTAGDRDYHLMNCPDRAPLDRKVSQNALEKNNPFKGRTAVPTFSDPVEVHDEENWDLEETATNILREAPLGAIIEPQAMAKPAERRKLYMELHRYPTEADGTRNSSSSVTQPSPVPRQPKQPSETQKLQNTQQQLSTKGMKNLGLGRGKPTRIAANIFDNGNGEQLQTPSFSNVVKNMSSLGIGRGQPAIQDSTVPLFNDDEDFPALGCGRGALRAPKQSPRTPGVKPQK